MSIEPNDKPIATASDHEMYQDERRMVVISCDGDVTADFPAKACGNPQLFLYAIVSHTDMVLRRGIQIGRDQAQAEIRRALGLPG